MLAHHARTPLSIERLQIEMLLGESFGKINRRQKIALKEILACNKKLADMLGAFSIMAELESEETKFNIVPANLKEIAEEASDRLSKEAREKKTKVVLKFPKSGLVGKTDKNRLSIALQNILSNAIKHSEKGQVVSSLKKTNGSVLFSISDSGSGIPKDEQKKIFTKTFRGANEKDKGAGLGLYNARLIVRKLGGKIWFKSRKNSGATFFINLPL